MAAVSSIPWQLCPSQRVEADLLAQRHRISPAMAQLLLNRGIADEDSIQQHLYGRLADLPQPATIPGMEAAVERLCGAINAREAVCLFGDYDVDGMTGCAILAEFLQTCGVPVHVYIPNRRDDGYGLSIAALESLHAQGFRLIVTIDNGTTAFTELDWAAAHGLEIIIIDHHESPTRMPPCVALINPKHPQSAHPDKNLCSAALVFNLCVALRAELRERGYFRQHAEPDLRAALDLVALGLVADMVPLLGQNRLLTRHGLRIMNETQRPGLIALKESSNLLERRIGTYELGFYLAPRLNAAGRMADARLGVKLLTTRELGEARALAQELELFNQDRRQVEREMFEEALRQVEDQAEDLKARAIVVASARWHAGVMGIVASRLVEYFQKPAFVIALQGEYGKGSARTYGDLNLYTSLQACDVHLLRYGGHQAAAGLTLAADQVLPFTERLQSVLAEDYPHAAAVPLRIDQELAVGTVHAGLMSELELLAPFGMGHPEPLFMSEPLRLLSPRVVAEKHLKVRIRSQDQDWDAIYFGGAAWCSELSPSAYFQVAYRPEWNEYRGSRSIQLQIKNMRKA